MRRSRQVYWKRGLALTAAMAFVALMGTAPAAHAATPDCSGFTVNQTVSSSGNPADDADPWDSGWKVQVQGSMPGTSCQIALPITDSNGQPVNWTSGVYPFESGAGQMVVEGGVATFTIDEAYAVTHPAPYDVSGWIAFGVTRTKQERTEGTDLSINLPGVSKPIELVYGDCPNCHAMPEYSHKWSNIDVATKRVTSEIRVGTKEFQANPTQDNWVVKDTFGTPQTCVSAELRYYTQATGDDPHWIRSVTCDEAMNGTALGDIDPSRTYGLLVVSTAHNPGNQTDTGTIMANNKLVKTVTAEAVWNDGGADGSGGDVVYPTATPRQEPYNEEVKVPVTKTVHNTVLVQVDEYLPYNKKGAWLNGKKFKANTPLSPTQLKNRMSLDDDNKLTYREDGPNSSYGANGSLWPTSNVKFITVSSDEIERYGSWSAVVKAKTGWTPTGNQTSTMAGQSVVKGWVLGEGANKDHPWGTGRNVAQTDLDVAQPRPSVTTTFETRTVTKSRTVTDWVCPNGTKVPSETTACPAS